MVLSATVKNGDGQNVGTFALKPNGFGSEQQGWMGEATLEIGGDRYMTWCLLVPLGPPIDEVAAPPAGGP